MGYGHKANWAKIKVSGASFKEHSVPVNSKSRPAHLGYSASPDKKPSKRR